MEGSVVAFIRIRTIKGKQYRYREERWREGGKVRSRSTCLGPVGGGRAGGVLGRLIAPAHGIDWVKIEREELERQHRESAAQKAFAVKMHNLYGMNLTTSTVPIEKVAQTVDVAAPVADAQENASSDDEAEVQ